MRRHGFCLGRFQLPTFALKSRSHSKWEVFRSCFSPKPFSVTTCGKPSTGSVCSFLQPRFSNYPRSSGVITRRMSLHRTQLDSLLPRPPSSSSFPAPSSPAHSSAGGHLLLPQLVPPPPPAAGTLLPGSRVAQIQIWIGISPMAAALLLPPPAALLPPPAGPSPLPVPPSSPGAGLLLQRPPPRCPPLSTAAAQTLAAPTGSVEEGMQRGDNNANEGKLNGGKSSMQICTAVKLAIFHSNICLLCKWFRRMENASGLWRNLIRNKYHRGKTPCQCTAKAS